MSEPMDTSTTETQVSEQAVPLAVVEPPPAEEVVSKVKVCDRTETANTAEILDEDLEIGINVRNEKTNEPGCKDASVPIDSGEARTSTETTFVDIVGRSKVTEEENNDRNNEITDTIEDAKEIEESDETLRLVYDWRTAPKFLSAATEEYTPTEDHDNFTKGCQWSPDGTCLLVPAEDFRIRIYELPLELYNGKLPEKLPLGDLKPALSVREGGLVYNCCWYPLMNSWDPPTCCFLSTSKESPLHLWDAFTGELRATYRPYNQVDEVEAAISAQFVEQGREIWSGFKGALRSFDTERPGRQKDTISLKTDFPNVTGIVSCIRENPAMSGLIAFGTYSKFVGLYKDGPLCSLKTDSGVTQIEFSPCGTKLYTAVRRNEEFLCWDLRNPGEVLFSLQDRKANTNQRVQFSVSPDGSEIISGGTDGSVTIWKTLDTMTEEDLNPVSKFNLSNDCINGVDLHKRLPILATTSGQRICAYDERGRDNSVRIWYL